MRLLNSPFRKLCLVGLFQSRALERTITVRYTEGRQAQVSIGEILKSMCLKYIAIYFKYKVFDLSISGLRIALLDNNSSAFMLKSNLIFTAERVFDDPRKKHLSMGI